MKKKDRELWELLKLALKTNPMYLAAWIIIFEFMGKVLGFVIGAVYSIVEVVKMI